MINIFTDRSLNLPHKVEDLKKITLFLQSDVDRMTAKMYKINLDFS